MSNATSPQPERTEPSGPRRCRHGVKSSPQREPDVPGDLLRDLIGNVTEPFVTRPPWSNSITTGAGRLFIFRTTTVRLSIEQIQLVIWRRIVVVVVNVLKGAEKLDFLERVDG
jgi:hypothetical protein